MEHEERLKAVLADRYLIEREAGSGGMDMSRVARNLKHNAHDAAHRAKRRAAP